MDIAAALNHLLASPLFARFETALQQDSIFDVLKINSRELSHASFLAWLLDPEEGHDAGEMPLKLFLLRAASVVASKGVSSEITPMVIDALDLSSAVVDCEYQFTKDKSEKGRLDIVVDLPRDGKEINPLLVFEHKVFAEESGSQTDVYVAWANKNKFSHPPVLEGEHMPLMVYVAPMDPEDPPAGPFVVFDYNQLSQWLDDVIANTGINRHGGFLINEYKACLRRLDLAPNHAAKAAQDDLHGDPVCHKAIEVLQLGGDMLRRYDDHVTRHFNAFTRLGIQPTRVKSKGVSHTVIELRKRVVGVFKDSDWQLSGSTGSLAVDTSVFTACFKSAVVHGGFEKYGWPYMRFYVGRPANGEASVEFFVGTNSGDDPTATMKTKEAVLQAAESLRKAITNAGLDYAKGRKGNKIAICKLRTPSIKNAADDTEELLAGHKSEIDKAVVFFEKLRPIVDQWFANDLPKLIANWNPEA